MRRAREERLSDEVREDRDLVREALSDRQYFGALYERYRDRVYAYLRARTTTPEDASDLMQHVFLQALDHLPRYRGERDAFAAWLFRIARNAAVDFHRRSRDTIQWDHVPEGLLPTTSEELTGKLLYQDEIARLRQLVDRLDKDVQELLALRFAAQLSIKEIAVVLGKREATVKKRLDRTVSRLKEAFHDATYG